MFGLGQIGSLAIGQLPNPPASAGPISGVLAALETKDIFAGFGVLGTPIVGAWASLETQDVFSGAGTISITTFIFSGEIGIIVLNDAAGEIGMTIVSS